MTGVPILPPDGADWSIASEPAEGGVDLVVTFPLAGEMHTLRIFAGRNEARTFAQGVLASAGDAAERTSPHAKILEAVRGR